MVTILISELLKEPDLWVLWSETEHIIITDFHILKTHFFTTQSTFTPSKLNHTKYKYRLSRTVEHYIPKTVIWTAAEHSFIISMIKMDKIMDHKRICGMMSLVQHFGDMFYELTTMIILSLDHSSPKKCYLDYWRAYSYHSRNPK